MPFLLLGVGALTFLANTAVDNLTTKPPEIVGGGTKFNLPIFVSVPLIIGDSFVAIKIAKKALK